MSQASPASQSARSRRRARLLRRLTSGIGATFGAAILVAAFVLPAAAVHDDVFQLDGNTADDPVTEPYDWENLFSDSTPDEVGGITVGPLPAGFVDAAFVEDWALEPDGDFETSDGSTFATGSKDTLEINTGWACVGSNNVNNKTDITNAYATIFEEGDEKILYFGLEKGEDNGNNNVGLWVLQNNVSCPEDSAPPGTAFSGTHADGDLFLVSAFTNGGGVSNITAYQWSTALGGIDPTPVAVGADCTLAADDDSICATTNAESTGGSEFSPDWTHFSTKFGVNSGLEHATFFEGGIDLTAFDEFADNCFTGFIFNTRSSQELGATLFDYAQGDIDTCAPDLSFDKEPETQSHLVGESFDWTLTVTNDGDGDATDAVVSDTIPDGLTINSATVDPSSAGDCEITGQDVECTVDVPAEGGEVTITINVTSTLDVFEEDEGCVLVTNTGSVEQAEDESTGNDSDSADATICRPLVEKTADGEFDRAWEWTIEKVGDQTDLLLAQGQPFDVNYDVTVDATSTDSDFVVSGTITIENPSADDDMTVDVEDELSSGESAGVTDIECDTDGDTIADDDGDDVLVEAGETITCTYSIDHTTTPDADDTGTNTATVTLDTDDVDTEFTATDDYDFVGFLGTVCAGDAPKTFEYVIDVGTETSAECGEHTFTNVADFVTNDTDATGDDDHTVNVTVNCEEGCTLTQGYWKTHSEFGPAPEDEDWYLIGDADGDGNSEGPNETFFLSGQTWYDVFWTKPGGNAYYTLAKQYMAAVLNIANGADSPANVDTAIAQAETLFETYTPAQIGALKGSKPPRPQFISLAGTLGSYNEGLIGPGHCDEDSNSSSAA